MPHKLAIALVTFFSLIILLFATFYIAIQRGINQPLQSTSETVDFIINPGEGVKQIGSNLKQAGLISRPSYFYLYVAWKKLDKKLQAGEYLLDKNMSIAAIADSLTKGKAAEKKITLREGLTIKEIAEQFKKNSLIKKESDFIDLTKPAPGTCFSLEACQVSILGEIPAGATLEGYLFPDTYNFFNQTAPADVIAKMLRNFDEKLTADMRVEIQKQKRSLADVITLASIVEKEAGNEAEMPVIAGIFKNRLDAGVALQSDATLSYFLNDNKAAHSTEEIKVDSLYNTYRYKGLPPGPICNPGLAAIKAALNPAKTNYFYFLHDQQTGRTYFSKTLEEHNLNKQLYLR